MTTPRFQRTKIKPKSYADSLQDEVDKGRMDKKEKIDSLSNDMCYFIGTVFPLDKAGLYEFIDVFVPEFEKMLIKYADYLNNQINL